MAKKITDSIPLTYFHVKELINFNLNLSSRSYLSMIDFKNNFKIVIDFRLLFCVQLNPYCCCFTINAHLDN